LMINSLVRDDYCGGFISLSVKNSKKIR